MLDHIVVINLGSPLVVVIVGAPPLKLSLGHDLILRKCNFLLFDRYSLLIVVFDIIGLPCKLATKLKLSLPFDDLSLACLVLGEFIQI